MDNITEARLEGIFSCNCVNEKIVVGETAVEEDEMRKSAYYEKDWVDQVLPYYVAEKTNSSLGATLFPK